MGVPCITLRGGGHAHNVGVSLLTAVGLAGESMKKPSLAADGEKSFGQSANGSQLGSCWIADNEEQYVALAVSESFKTFCYPGLAWSTLQIESVRQ